MSKATSDRAKQLKDFIHQAQEQLEEMQEKGKDFFEDVHDKKSSVEEFVKDNPLLAIGGAFVAGWFIGRLLKKSHYKKRR